MTNSNNNRLDNIATRQRGSRVRDFLFAASVALMTVMSISSMLAA